MKSFFTRKSNRDLPDQNGSHFIHGEPYGDEEVYPSVEPEPWRSASSNHPRKNKSKRAKKQSSDNSPGMTSEVGQLYRDNDESQWDEWMPDSVGRDLEDSSEYKKFAVIVRRERRQGKPGIPLHSVVVQSPLLRKVLDLVFEGYEGISTKLRHLKFYAPMHEFYFCWHRFEKLYQDKKDNKTRQHLDLLYPIISEEILPHIQTMEDMTKNGVITFKYLWAIFPPGMAVYSKVDDQDRFFSLKNGEYIREMNGSKIFRILCQYIDCDGTQFGHVAKSLYIYPFDGLRKITDLDVCPGHLRPDKKSILEKLLRRGEAFENLNGYNHVAYSGFYIDRSSRSYRKRHVRLSTTQ